MTLRPSVVAPSAQCRDCGPFKPLVSGRVLWGDRPETRPVWRPPYRQPEIRQRADPLSDEWDGPGIFRDGYRIQAAQYADVPAQNGNTHAVDRAKADPR
ncbi:hypothetical protein [Streptomyces sp. 769]|uniref:hypothetical protein n=1 Tax=Streptomyces sp. 769 TaxID=1262452 RepID=UPI00131D4EFE|nr:hypothetical protein [Streptomyces sp. 769]